MAGRLLIFRRKPAQQGAEAGLSPADQERFRRLVLPHLGAAYNFARFLLRDGPAAEDIVHDAFIRAFNAFPGFRGDNPKAWLFAIVRNLVFSSARAERIRAEVFAPEPAGEGAPAEEDGPEALAIRGSEVQAVRTAIEALPEPFREALVLRELEELSYREVASVTGAPIGTVMSRLSRARQMLAAALSDQEGVRA
jgi:RNA polymerase sigma-70 factor (ECF subfamily)